MFSFFSSVHMCRSGDFVLIRGRERRPKGHSSEAYLVFPTTSLHIISVNNPHVNCHGISHLSLGVDRLSAWPIIGADIKLFTDYRYRPFSKHICRYIFCINFFFYFFFFKCKQTYYLQVTLFIGE